MRFIKYILNLPWTLVGLVAAFTGVPTRIYLGKDAIVFRTRTCGVVHLWAGRAKGFTFGNVAVAKADQSEQILEHEFVHIAQNMRHPLIQPFLYWHELLTKGYWHNKYEIEAYDRSNTWPAEQRSKSKEI